MKLVIRCQTERYTGRMRPLVFALLLAGAACRRDPASEQAKLEQEFERTMTNSTLTGKFSSLRNDRLSEDRYTISKVSRMAGNIWLIQTRIQYGGNDYTVPVPVKVLWAGDTPVITLDDVTIPNRGTFSARVLVHKNQYAGTWSHSKGGGGQMFGRVERSK